MIHITKKDLMPFTIEDDKFGGLRVTEDRLPHDFSFNVKFKLAKGCDEVEHTGTIIAYDFSPSYLFAIIKVDQETWYPDNLVSISVDELDYFIERETIVLATVGNSWLPKGELASALNVRKKGKCTNEYLITPYCGGAPNWMSSFSFGIHDVQLRHSDVLKGWISDSQYGVITKEYAINLPKLS